MDVNEPNEERNTEMISVLLYLIAYIITPFLIIWAINTLFQTEIPQSFKTWLAGLVMVMVIRFHMKPTINYHCPEQYYDEDEYEEDKDNEEINQNQSNFKDYITPKKDHNQ